MNIDIDISDQWLKNDDSGRGIMIQHPFNPATIYQRRKINRIACNKEYIERIE